MQKSGVRHKTLLQIINRNAAEVIERQLHGGKNETLDLFVYTEYISCSCYGCTA